MAKDISTLTNGELVKALTKFETAVSKACNLVYAAEERTDVGFRDILEKIGSDHPAALAYYKASSDLANAKYEAQRRVGPVTYDMTSMYITYLQSHKRRKRAA